MPSAICSNLLPHYTTWKSSLDEMRRAMVAYQESGSDADRIAFDYAMKNGEEAGKKYRKEAYQKTVRRTFWSASFSEEQTSEICYRDALLMERIQACFESHFSTCYVSVKNYRITSLEHFPLREDMASEGNAFLRYVAMLSGLITLIAPQVPTVVPEKLPPGLEVLRLSRAQITVLPKNLPSRLRELHIDGTAITCVPNNLPSTVTTLICGDNRRITALPDPLPPNLETLSCSLTNITTLPPLPDSLKSLICLGTKISQLPSPLPKNLTQLLCADTLINDLPDPLPSSLTMITITNTPAARNPFLRNRLDAFKRRYPDVIIRR